MGAPVRLDVGARVRHRPTGDVGAVLSVWGAASVIVRFDEPDENGQHVAAVLREG